MLYTICLASRYGLWVKVLTWELDLVDSGVESEGFSSAGIVSLGSTPWTWEGVELGRHCAVGFDTFGLGR